MNELTAKIYISASETLEINRNNVLSVSRNTTDRADYKLPTFGIISNTSEIEFNDVNGKVLQYANDLKLQEGLDCEIYLKNSIYNKNKVVGIYKTATWNYDNNNKKVSVSLKDDLEEWQDINVEGFGYDAKNRKSQTLYIFYEYLRGKTPTKYNMLAFNELDDNTKAILNNITIMYPMLKSGSLWQQWTKLCQVAQAHIYKKVEIINDKFYSRTAFVYRGGN